MDSYSGVGHPEIEVDPETGVLLLLDAPYDIDPSAEASWNIFEVYPGDTNTEVINRAILSRDVGLALGEFTFVPVAP